MRRPLARAVSALLLFSGWMALFFAGWTAGGALHLLLLAALALFPWGLLRGAASDD
jgi:hypothetical protein